MLHFHCGEQASPRMLPFIATWFDSKMTVLVISIIKVRDQPSTCCAWAKPVRFEMLWHCKVIHLEKYFVKPRWISPISILFSGIFLAKEHCKIRVIEPNFYPTVSSKFHLGEQTNTLAVRPKPRRAYLAEINTRPSFFDVFYKTNRGELGFEPVWF